MHALCLSYYCFTFEGANFIARSCGYALNIGCVAGNTAHCILYTWIVLMDVIMHLRHPLGGVTASVNVQSPAEYTYFIIIFLALQYKYDCYSACVERLDLNQNPVQQNLVMFPNNIAKPLFSSNLCSLSRLIYGVKWRRKPEKRQGKNPHRRGYLMYTPPIRC